MAKIEPAVAQVEKKELAKIDKVAIGYYEGRGAKKDYIGLHVTIKGQDWKVCDFIGYPSSVNTGVSARDKTKQMEETMGRIDLLLRQSKRLDITDLEGLPVEVVWDTASLSPLLKSWRLLTELI